MKKLVKSAIGSAFFLISHTPLNVSPAWSQTIPTERAAQPSPPVAYYLFFGHLVFLDEKAAEVERRGKPGAAFRNYYKARLRLQDDDEAALIRRSKACEKEVADHDAKAAKVIAELRSRIPKGKTPADVPMPQEIFQLQAERDAILEKHLAGLKSDLRPESFGRVDSFVRGEFSRRSSVRTVTNDQQQRLSVSKAAERARIPATP